MYALYVHVYLCTHLVVYVYILTYDLHWDPVYP